MSTEGFIPFVSVILIDYSLKQRSQPCLLFKNVMQCRCCGHPKMSTVFYVVASVFASLNALSLFLVVQRGVGKSFPWSQRLAYQPHNKGSLWVAAGGGPSECAAVADVWAAPGRPCALWPELSSTLPRDGNWSHSCGSRHGCVGCLKIKFKKKRAI